MLEYAAMTCDPIEHVAVHDIANLVRAQKLVGKAQVDTANLVEVGEVCLLEADLQGAQVVHELRGLSRTYDGNDVIALPQEPRQCHPPRPKLAA